MKSPHVLRSIARPRNVISVFTRSAANQALPRRRITHSRQGGIHQIRTETPEEQDQTTRERFHEVMRRVPHPVVVVTAFDCPNISTETSSGKVYAEIPAHWSDQDVSATTNMTDRMQRVDDPRQLAPIARAMTVSSFASLSMKPKPIVLFNCSVPSRTHRAIANSGIFAIHILTADEQGAKIADLFARGQQDQQPASGPKPDELDLSQARLGTLAQLSQLGVHVTSASFTQKKWAERFKHVVAAPDVHRWRKWGMSPPQLEGPGILYRLTCRLVDPRFDSFSSNQENTIKSAFALVMGVVSFVKPAAGARLNKTTLSYVGGTYCGESKAVLEHKVATSTTPDPRETASTANDHETDKVAHPPKRDPMIHKYTI